MMTWRRKGAGADEAPGAQGGERAGAKTPFFAKRIQRSLIGLRQWEQDDVAVERNKKRGGPRTPDGKQWARRNAIKHGVFAQTPVVPPPRGREGPGAAAAGCARLVLTWMASSRSRCLSGVDVVKEGGRSEKGTAEAGPGGRAPPQALGPNGREGGR